MLNIATYAQMKIDLMTHFVFKAGARHENDRVKVAIFNTIAKGPNGEDCIAVTGGKIPYNAATFMPTYAITVMMFSIRLSAFRRDLPLMS